MGQTVDEIKSQIRLATTDTEGAVIEAQKKSGIKDRIAQHWIELAIVKRRELNKMRITNAQTKDPRLTTKALTKDEREIMKLTIQKEISDEVFEWIIQQPPHQYNALPLDFRELR